MKVPRRTRRAPEIPLSSMSDIAMLLLIFFIVTTQFIVQRSLQAELPSVTHDQEEQEEPPITVVVEQNGLFLDADHITMEDLAPFLAAKLANKTKPEDKAVILDGRPGVKWQRFTQAVNEIKRAGGLVVMSKVED